MCYFKCQNILVNVFVHLLEHLSFGFRCLSFFLSKFASQLELIQSVVRVGILGICVSGWQVRGSWVSEPRIPRSQVPGSQSTGSRVSESWVSDSLILDYAEMNIITISWENNLKNVLIYGRYKNWLHFWNFRLMTIYKIYFTYNALK